MSENDVIVQTTDTLDAKRHFIGEHEMQVSEKGEGDLHSFYLGCTKNPEHASFIPVNSFTLDHLPEGFRDEDVYQVVQALADLTVKVTVTFTSLDRPEHQPGSDAVPYPFYKSRGKTTMRVGTGLVDNVTKYDGVPCACRECRLSERPQDVWAELEVFTASHVVFDESEAGATVCRLFYDEPSGACVNLSDVRMWESDVQKDKCRLICVTHDEGVIDRLVGVNNRRKILCRRVRGKYWGSRGVDKLTVIVSHPHGCQKQISVGEWRLRSDDGLQSMYTYTTPTCPGSSGAYVYVLGSVGWWYEYVHKGVNCEGVNFSGSGYDPDFRS